MALEFFNVFDIAICDVKFEITNCYLKDLQVVTICDHINFEPVTVCDGFGMQNGFTLSNNVSWTGHFPSSEIGKILAKLSSMSSL